ncbi:OprD family porin [Pseudomonas sp. J452]|uniref:OprD family porin n=1 Tax=Pseudomonas sp. J452 TaxID=2898441 RepID=UPI0021AE278E|nr:OprD family porin [Pseudomonas sp. J452]UUY10340.1 OprD family porin [Pseudomonas sp. J452]
MPISKWSTLALAVAACAAQAALADDEAEPQGFVEGAGLTLTNRNFYMNSDFRDNGPDEQSYQEEWAHGVLADFASGFTEGTVGFGVDAFGYFGIKLDSGRGRTGTGLLPVGGDGRAEDEYGEAGGALKLRLSSTQLKYGEMQVETPVFDTAHLRLLPETATGFLVESSEIEGLDLTAGHFTAFNNRDSSNSGDEFYGYGGDTSAGGIDFVGGWYSFNDNLSAGLFASELEDTWRQYYGNLNYYLQIDDEQAVTFDFNIYRSNDHGDALAGAIDTTSYSLALAYSLGIHTLTLAHQRVNGDTPFDYVGGDSIYLANSLQYSDFNAPNERSWQLRYDLDLGNWVPGLGLMTRYVRGDNIDGSHADPDGVYVDYYGEDGKHWERDVEINYVVQEGAAKDLSIAVRQATHRANTDQGEGDLDEVRLILEYPLEVL